MHPDKKTVLKIAPSILSADFSQLGTEVMKAQAGGALNPATPVDLIKPVLDKIDLLIIMSVNPGFGGQDFIPDVLPKILSARQIIDGHRLAVDIAVDGGINEETARLVALAGANVLVAGTAIFLKGDIVNATKTLRKSALSVIPA